MIEGKEGETILIPGTTFKRSDELANLIVEELCKAGDFAFYEEIYSADEMLFDRAVKKVKSILYKSKEKLPLHKYQEYSERSVNSFCEHIKKGKK